MTRQTLTGSHRIGIEVAAIEFEHVYAPVGKSLSIQLEVTGAAGIAAAGLRACVTINSEFQTAIVHLKSRIIGHLVLRGGGNRTGTYGNEVSRFIGVRTYLARAAIPLGNLVGSATSFPVTLSRSRRVQQSSIFTYS